MGSSSRVQSDSQTAVTTVVIVDDSPTARAVLRKILQADGSIRVIGEAADGRRGLEEIRHHSPDVVLMDVMMPVLDGLETTRILMSEDPRPILLISDLVGVDAELNFRALEAGALDIMGKPSIRLLEETDDAHRFRRRVRGLAGIPLVRRRRQTTGTIVTVSSESRPAVELESLDLVVVGASTGGPPALHLLLSSIPGEVAAPILIVQHMSGGFIDGMVKWLDRAVGRSVRLAEEGVRPGPGMVYVAPDGGHMVLRRTGSIGIDSSAPLASHRPAADALFHSIASHRICSRTVGILLTGMGADGAAGLLEMRNSGAWTISQDEQSSVVYGMPRAARELGAAREVLPVQQIGPRLGQLHRRLGRSQS